MREHRRAFQRLSCAANTDPQGKERRSSCLQQQLHNHNACYRSFRARPACSGSGAGGGGGRKGEGGGRNGVGGETEGGGGGKTEGSGGGGNGREWGGRD